MALVFTKKLVSTVYQLLHISIRISSTCIKYYLKPTCFMVNHCDKKSISQSPLNFFRQEERWKVV